MVIYNSNNRIPENLRPVRIVKEFEHRITDTITQASSKVYDLWDLGDQVRKRIGSFKNVRLYNPNEAILFIRVNAGTEYLVAGNTTRDISNLKNIEFIEIRSPTTNTGDATFELTFNNFESDSEKLDRIAGLAGRR